MKKRGRPSSASLSVARIGPSGIEAVARPEPPPELSEEEAADWRAIVDRLPADWFPAETLALLAAYCRHIVAARRIAGLVRAMEQGDGQLNIRDYDRLLKMQERETRCLASLAVKMRISQSTTYDKSKRKPIQAPPPWEQQG